MIIYNFLMLKQTKLVAHHCEMSLSERIKYCIQNIKVLYEIMCVLNIDTHSCLYIVNEKCYYNYRYRRKKPAASAKNVETVIRNHERTYSDHSLSSKHSLIGDKNGSVVPSSPSDIPMTPLEGGS